MRGVDRTIGARPEEAIVALIPKFSLCDDAIS
jgi:hypothetical protein